MYAAVLILSPVPLHKHAKTLLEKTEQLLTKQKAVQILVTAPNGRNQLFLDTWSNANSLDDGQTLARSFDNFFFSFTIHQKAMFYGRN